MLYTSEVDLRRGVMGATRLGTTDLNDEERIRARTRMMLARALNTRSVVAFVGSGVSNAYEARPGWKEFADAVIGEVWDDELSEPSRRQLDQFSKDGQKVLNWGDVATAAFSTCERELRARGKDGRVQDLAHELFSPPSRGPRHPDMDPLVLLMRELGIRRFVTTNYDDEIEAAWSRFHAEAKDHAAPKIPKSVREVSTRGLTHELALSFATGSSHQGAEVFHAHGKAQALRSSDGSAPVGAGWVDPVVEARQRSDRDLLLVSADDYNRQYADSSPEASAYRAALSHLFAASAVLFVGVGMTEYDLLGPLRMVEAQRARSGYDLPVFALMPTTDDPDKDVEQRILLNVRYGVKVIHFAADGSAGLTGGLCNALRQMAVDRDTWFLSWQRIPVVRAPKFAIQGHTVWRHGAVAYDARPTIDTEPVIEALRSGPPTLLVHQRQTGSGSDRLARAIVERIGRSFERVFVASLYLVHELLSIVEAAGEHFAGGSRPGRSWPTEWLGQVLNEGQHLLIISGCERLLHLGTPVDRQPWVKEGERTVYLGAYAGRPERALFEMLAKLDKGTKSRVVLMGNAFPASLWEEHQLRSQFALCRPDAPAPETWRSVAAIFAPDVRDQAEQLLQSIRRLTRGHLTSLQLCEAGLRSLPPARRLGFLSRLASELSALNREDRYFAVFHHLMEVLRSKDAEAVRVLDWVSRFTTPVEARVVSIAAQLGEDRVNRCLSELEQLQLIHRVEAPDLPVEPRWAAQLVARQWASRRIGGTKRIERVGPPQRFGLSGFTRDPDDHHQLSDTGAGDLSRAIDRLIRAAQKDTHEFGGADPVAARRMFRGAFDLLRTHFSVSVVRRIPEGASFAGGAPLLTAYHRLLLRLANLLRDGPTEDVNTSTWLRADVEDVSEVVHVDGWLYADELAWFLNELGQVPFVEGQMQDARGLFRMARHAQAPIERHRRGWRWARDQMLLGAVEIDRARLSDAAEILEEARHGAGLQDDHETVARCAGYLGLVRYHQGAYQEAEKHLTDALAQFPSDPNHRAISVFSRIRGELFRHMKVYDRAHADLLTALGAADRGGHPDLHHHAALAEILKCCSRRPREELDPRMADYHGQVGRAEAFGRRLGSARLVVHALTARIRLQELNGDLHHAWEVAARRVTLTRRMGLRLGYIAALAHAGHVARVRGRPDALQLLDDAEARAERAGYATVIERVRHARR